jgi:hypothetical protein
MTHMGADDGVGGNFDFDVARVRRTDGIHDVSHPRAKRSTVKDFKNGVKKRATGAPARGVVVTTQGYPMRLGSGRNAVFSDEGKGEPSVARDKNSFAFNCNQAWQEDSSHQGTCAAACAR